MSLSSLSKTKMIFRVYFGLIISSITVICGGGVKEDLAAIFVLVLDGSQLQLSVPVEAPPYETASNICKQYQLYPSSPGLPPEQTCEMIVSTEINRVQSIKMANHGSGGIGVHEGEYFLKSNLLERELHLHQHEITEG